MSLLRIATVLAFSLVACMVTPSRVLTPTPTGRPECMVPDATPAEVMDRCAELLAAQGWEPHSRSADELVVRRQGKDALIYDHYPTKEVRLAFTARDGGTHVLGQRSTLQRPGTPEESRFDLTNGQADYDLWANVLRGLPEHFAASATASK